MEAVAEGEDGTTCEPAVGSAGGFSRHRAEGHFGERDLVGVVGGVLGYRESTSGGGFPGDEVEDGGSAALAGVACEEDGRDVGVGEQGGVVDLVA